MISNAGTAKKVSALLAQCLSDLDESAGLVQAEASDEEFKRYRRAVGAVMGELVVELLRPLYARHPELKPEGYE
jgi:hypothetical protein